MLLAGADRRSAERTAERMHAAVRGASIAGLDVTMSFGVTASVAGQPFEFDPVFARADAALYEAKLAGRDQVRVAIAPAEEPVVVEHLPVRGGAARAADDTGTGARGAGPRAPRRPRSAGRRGAGGRARHGHCPPRPAPCSDAARTTAAGSSPTRSSATTCSTSTRACAASSPVAPCWPSPACWPPFRGTAGRCSRAPMHGSGDVPPRAAAHRALAAAGVRPRRRLARLPVRDRDRLQRRQARADLRARSCSCSSSPAWVRSSLAVA